MVRILCFILALFFSLDAHAVVIKHRAAGDTFPRNGVFETFTGTNGTVPTGWTNVLNQIQIQTNQAASNSSGGAVAYRGGTAYGPTTTPGIEVYATLTVKPPNGSEASLYILTNTTQFDGYSITINATSGTDAIYITRCDDSVDTILSTTNVEFAAGDQIGLEIIGSSIKAYRKPAAGSWAQVGSTVTNSTYSGNGYPALYISDTTTRLDDIGGGTIF